MATKKPVAAPAADDDRTELRRAVDVALDGKPYGDRVEVRLDGQTFVAWRASDGTVHVENRGA